jgi:type I restriction enzyme S subunit
MMSEKKIAPKLRFPGFTEDWSISMFGDVVDITSASRVHKDEWTEHGIPFYRSSDVVAAFKGTQNTKAHTPFDLFKSLTDKIGRVKKDDLLITGGGSIGISFLIKNDEPLYFKDADLLWIKNYNKTIRHFLYSFFTTPLFRRYLKTSAHIGTIAHYTVIQAKNTPFQFPSLPEQQKIATFLTAVDRRIELLEQKKEKLEAYKKGVMQQLFSRQIRFKQDDGSVFPEWEEKKLGEIGEFRGGGTPSSSVLEYWDGEIPWISSSDVKEDSIFHIATTRFISEKALLSSATKLIPAKSILIVSRVGVGKLAYTKESVCTSQDFSNLTPKKGIDPIFLAFSLSFNSSKIKNLSQGTSIKGVTMEEVKKIRVLLPSLIEQRKIVSFLRSLDDTTKKVINQINQTQTWRRGLLQQMFI